MDVDRIRGNLAPRASGIAGKLNGRITGNERVLEQLGVAGVFEVHIATRQRLQRTGQLADGWLGSALSPAESGVARLRKENGIAVWRLAGSRPGSPSTGRPRT